ncbi:DinB family protein [Paenibacillus sp. FSL W8-0426]|uniref:DinB family protein n=1 Tax=Paenibacillus sp. FSL W8-0426 TaxID=2921714 RepID=UPI0030DC2230
MRETEKVLQSLEETIGQYLSELNNLDMEQLLHKRCEEEWSVGQMYMHLIQSALFMHLKNVDQCLADHDFSWSTVGEKTEEGKAVFKLGSFPQVRIRVPASPQYTPQQPQNKEQLTDGLNRVMERMKSKEPDLYQAPDHKKVPHPRLGELNAKEWFMLIEMHYRHHLLQLERLKNDLKMNEGHE